MPRPCKRRRICMTPGCERFGPRGEEAAAMPPVTMTVDEYESIRLIDLEGMTQDACAKQMNVARTTAQAIYGSARQKLAVCLVMGRELHIYGGEYVLCGGECGCGRPCTRRSAALDHEEERSMKIAVTYEQGEVFQHFGHTAQFKLYTITDGKVTDSAIVDTNGSGHGALASFLTEQGVDTLICGGIGGGARTALAQAEIRLFGGVTGSADRAVDALLKGELQYQPDIRCAHHDHGEGHTCGDHGCGEHHCG